MNKIYKVIWSKVKNQYVVVSELAHSNGKQSRTAKRSLRSRIAALVVCGAIAAFGVFGTQNVMAAEPEGGLATIDQYVAYKYNQGDGFQSGYKKVFVRDKNSTNPFDGQYYWVRNGYTVEGEYVQKQDGTGTTFVISKVYAPNGNIRDVLVTSDVTIDGTGVVTNSGEELNSVELGNYAAVSNGGKGGAEANTECHYIIETENGWENVGVGTDKFDEYFKTVDNDSENGLKYDNEKGVYTYKGEVVSSDNIYYIKDGDTVNAGVFVVNGEVYKSTVYGNTKEILTTVKDENGSLKTFWSTEAESSDIYLKDSNIKVSDLNTAFDTIEANEKRLENNDIREITVTPNENKIGLVRNSDKEVDGSIYVSSVVGENGNAQVKFAQKGEDGQETSSFVVDAGSIVKANPEGATSGTKLSTVAINGINYQLATGISGGEVGDDGTVYITQEGSTEKTPIGKIEVVGTDVNVTSEQTTNDDGVKGIKYTVSNNLTVAEDKDTDGNNGNWTITDTSKTSDNVFKNTTLDKKDSSDATVEIKGDSEHKDSNTVYGKNYKVIDTEGNEVELNDVASANTLKEVNRQVTENTSDIDVLEEADKLNVKYDNDNKNTVTLGGSKSYVEGTEDTTPTGGVRLTNVAYATGEDKSEAVNVEYLEDTVDSINEASYKGWTVTTNGGKIEADKAEVASNGNVDFSNTDGNIIVGQNGTNLTFDLNDKITLGDESSTRIELNGSPETDSMISITKGDSHTVFNVAKDGTVLSDGDIVAKADSNKKYSLSEVGENAVRYNNEDKSTVALAGTSGTTITNVADGALNKESTEAVNGSQLYAVDQKVDAGWTAKDSKGNIIAVNPTETGTTTLNFAGDNNITVTADTTNKAIQVALNDKVYLGGDHTEDSRNIVLDGERGVIGLGSNIALDGRDGTAVIGGVNITTTAEEGTGKPVSTINGLSNTTWTGTTETPNRAATEGQLEDLSDTVNTGWYVADKDTAEDSTTGNFAVKPGETLTFNGDDNIDVEAKDHKVNVSLKDNITLGEGNSQININGNPENGEAALSIGDKFVVEQNGTTTIVADDGINNRPSQAQLTPDTTVTIAPSGVTFAGDDKGTTIIEGQKITSGGIVINGEDIYDKTTGIVTKGTITGLSNTTWDGKTDNASRVATEGQLKAVSDDVNAGWIATDSQNHEVNITPDNNKLNFAGDENVTVTAANNEIKVALNDDIVLGDYLNGGDGVLIGGSSGTISATNSITVGEDQGLIIDGQKEEIQGLSNTTWNEDVANAVERDSVAASTAATQGQLQEVSKVANAGWNASDGTNSISVKPNETLNFVGDENLTVSADGTDKKLKVSLNDNITLGEGPNQIQLNGAPGANDPALSVGTDKFVVDQDGSLSVSDKFNVDAETGNIYAANNSGSAIMMNDDSVALNAGGNGIAISDEGILLNTNGINEDIKLVTKGTSVSVDSNGTTFTNVNTNETTNIDGGTINVGDKLVVDQDGTTTIAVNDGTVMGNNTTMTVNKDGVAFSAYGNGTTVIDGQTIYAGGVVINNNGSGTINGLTNTTWDDELAKQVANSEELQSTAATQGQLQQAVSEVAEVANAGWNAKAGGNTINVKPNETLNFEGDGNITVSATSGTSSELKFGLNHNITLDNVENEKTMMVFNTDGREGYIPDNYKEDNGQINDFIEEHGGFAIYYANPSLTTGDMTGTFGVTTDGVVHAKDVISYYSASSGSQSDVIRYSLNDVGDIVTQISHAVFDEGVGSTGMEYTLISDFEDEADKDSPFDAKEGKTRTIGLAVRQDGAVIVGAVVNDEGMSSDRGIRINAETKTTYDKNGNEVTNNIATITGLENTEWKPPTPVATFAANDGSATVTSRAATESQLNDLYSAVAAYDVNVDGTIDYSHIALAGTPYGASRSGNGTHTGGTSITNVAYASGKDGSEAVNVDYLNDAINNAVKDGGAISDSDRHLQEGTYHVNDQGKVELIVADEKGENQSTVTIDNIANKNDITNLDNKIDNTFNDLNDKINNIDNVETDVKGGNINEDGTISLKTENEDGTTTNVTLKGQLTDSGVVQEGTSFDKETGTITITSQDKYSGETSSVKVEGIASTEVVGATNKEDLATAYKDADKDGNATTEYITDSESMVEADVALDHAIQDVAGTSYANDMVLSNRIDSVEKRLGNVEERIDKVGAMAAAIANLRTMGFDPEAPTEIAIGVGQYKSETGIAIGVFHYPNQDFMLSASLSSSGDELMGGIGATWKLGRKSAAERAKDEEARHLEQAEEMKKLAQQEKVKAQAQRHAKLLAERQQASQKNA